MNATFQDKYVKFVFTDNGRVIVNLPVNDGDGDYESKADGQIDMSDIFFTQVRRVPKKDDPDWDKLEEMYKHAIWRKTAVVRNGKLHIGRFVFDKTSD